MILTDGWWCLLLWLSLYQSAQCAVAALNWLTDWAGTAQLTCTPTQTHQHFIYLLSSLTQPCHIGKTNYNYPSLFTETLLLLEIFTSLLDSPPSLPCPAYIYSSAQLCLWEEKIYIWINWLTECESGQDLISKHVLFNKSTVMCDVTVC